MRFNMTNFLATCVLWFALTLWCIHLYSNTAFCSEDYYVDHQRTLLYKIINWWYDCHPIECDLYCGAAIKCTNQGNTQIEYSEANMILKLHIEGGIAGLLSVFKNCDRCIGPSYFHCTWQNEKYLGSGKAAAVSDLNQYVLYSIHNKEAQTIKSIKDDILFVVEGNIGGLSNGGTVALHQSGAFLKNCPSGSDDKGISFPISVRIINTKANDIIAEYMAIWTD